MKTHSYIPRTAKITAKKLLCEDVVALTLKFTEKKPFNFVPGQFVMVSVFGFGEVPVGISSSPREKGSIEITIRSAGMVTNKICSLFTGDIIGINGPFGNGFPLSKLKDKNVVLIAGGIGLFPLRSLIMHLGESKKFVRSLSILVGARCPEKLIFANEYKDWGKFAEVLATVDTCDKSWQGCTGNITKLYPKIKAGEDTVIIACGPPIMYGSVIDYFGKRVEDKYMYFDLERRMKCGIGKCQHCTCGKLYVCTDGPIFSLAEIKNNPEALK